MKWTQRPRMRGWIGGNELTLFSISKLSSKSSFRQKSCSSPRSVRTQGAKKNGNAATKYANRFPCLAGKCATPRTAQDSRGAARRDLEEQTRPACYRQSGSDFRRLAETTFCFARFGLELSRWKKFAITRTRSPARETRALPGKMRSQLSERFVMLSTENV